MNRKKTPVNIRNLKLLGLIVCLLMGLTLFIGCRSAEVVAPSPAPTTAATAAPTLDQTLTAAPGTATPEPIPIIEEPMNESSAANADVLFVKARQAADGSWTFQVTVAHPDTGWEDYADGWDVLLPDGQVFKPDADSPFTRLLLHPHENEQPFTRSQNRIIIPADVTEVRIRAHDLVDGFGGREVVVDLTASSGADFEVERQ